MHIYMIMALTFLSVWELKNLPKSAKKYEDEMRQKVASGTMKDVTVGAVKDTAVIVLILMAFFYGRIALTIHTRAGVLLVILIFVDELIVCWKTAHLASKYETKNRDEALIKLAGFNHSWWNKTVDFIEVLVFVYFIATYIQQGW